MQWLRRLAEIHILSNHEGKSLQSDGQLRTLAALITSELFQVGRYIYNGLKQRLINVPLFSACRIFEPQFYCSGLIEQQCIAARV
jgi:hypothetical protein